MELWDQTPRVGGLAALFEDRLLDAADTALPAGGQGDEHMSPSAGSLCMLVPMLKMIPGTARPAG